MDRWEYLISKEYKIRHHICEYYFQDVDSIIDVGAYKYSIPWKNVIAIDPLCSIDDNSFHGTVSQWLKEPFYGMLENCGVMALGLEIEGDIDEWKSFISLIEASKIAIIEHSIEHEPSVKQFNEIMKITKKRLTSVINLEFCQVDTPCFIPHSKRKLIILERI